MGASTDLLNHPVEPVRREIGDQIARDLVVAVLARPTHLSVEPIQPKRACFGMPKGGNTWTGMESPSCSWLSFDSCVRSDEVMRLRGMRAQ